MTDLNSVLVSNQGAVRQLQLNNIARRNALSAAIYHRLSVELKAAADDPAVRVLVISGSEGCFCSGNDLEDFLGNPIRDADHPIFNFMRALNDFPKPVVAAVEGAAVGIGTTLLLHCDLVYSGRSALFKMPFVQLGICPEFASSYLLPRLLGERRAAELLLLGKAVDGQRAEALGLINEVVGDGEALDRALTVAQSLAAMPPKAMRDSKKLLRDSRQPGVERALAAELEVLAGAVNYGELAEAIAALGEKRVPDFSRFE
ncbi:enoyl-CoA hydratase [Marinobacterium maritimum]|uniref:Enoyl-CoA hydratase n=1 Tax=Marinobacterium maritimum TaxID=500162 RepID=A0ABN1I320_9GAMM